MSIFVRKPGEDICDSCGTDLNELKTELMQCRAEMRKLKDILTNIACLDPLTQGDIAVHLALSTLKEEV